MGKQKKQSEKDCPTNIESTMNSLETLLKKMENSDTSIGESLQLFEEGITLIRTAQQALEQAEQKVQLLIEQDGALSVEELPANEEK